MKISKHNLNRYNKLIDHYKNNKMIYEGYVEKHHILPRCLGGTDDEENIISLPSRVHFIAHALLHKAYPEHRGLAHAFAMMGVNNPHQRRYTSNLYHMSKLARSNAMKGVPRSEATKQKMRKPKLNTENYKKPKSESHKQNMSKSFKGVPKSRDSINKMIETKKIYFQNKEREKIIKTENLQKLFRESKMTRKQFADSQNMNYNTLKKFLRGIKN